MRADQIKARVLIEGVLVPKVSQITVTSTATEISQATLTMPAIPGLETEELKRAHVAIFWSDVDIRSQVADDQWPLLFEGEIVGDSYNKTVYSRDQVFHCQGLSLYWEQIMLYAYDLSQGFVGTTPWTSAISLAVGNDRFQFEAPIAGANLQQRFIAKFQEAVARDKDSAYYLLVKNAFSEALDVNYFFRQRDQALKLRNRFVSAKDPGLQKLIGTDLLNSVLSNDVLTRGGETTIMTLLKDVLSVFRYQIVCNPQPVFVDSGYQKKKTAADKEKRDQEIRYRFQSYLVGKGVDDPTAKILGAEITTTGGQAQIDYVTQAAMDNITLTSTPSPLLADEIRGLAEFAVKDLNDSAGNRKWDARGLDIAGDDLLTQFLLLPDTRFALPPTCNIIFPGDQSGFSLDRQLAQEPTRAIGKPVFAHGVLPVSLVLAPEGLATTAVVPAETIVPASGGTFRFPLDEPYTLTSPWGKRTHPITKVKSFHFGVDLAAAKGRPIYAFDAGIVTRAHDTHDIGGQEVKINHGNMSTGYSHLSQINVVVGQSVDMGDVIGQVGSTGVYPSSGKASSTGNHLHFSIKINGDFKDPMAVMADKSKAAAAAIPQNPPSVTTEAVNLGDGTRQQTTDPWLEHRFLTPEEQVTGIVPFIDNDTLMRAHALLTYGGGEAQVIDHYTHMLNSELLWRRYQTRSLSALTMPFNPNPVAGFPALIIDKVRSLIGLVTNITHTLHVGGGQGVASTTVQIEAPRYWDEGDPYYWVGGKATVEPDSDKAHFPPYYLTSLLATNSTDAGFWSAEDKQTAALDKNRDVDRFYSALLGANVTGIPYQYAQRKLTPQGQTPVYNAAIAPREGKPAPNTLVGEYYERLRHDPLQATDYVRNLTRRQGLAERELMIRVLGAEPTTLEGVVRYNGPSFRPEYQEKIEDLNLYLVENQSFRG